MAGTDLSVELSTIMQIGDLRLKLTTDLERQLFKAQLGDLTLGAIITYLVHLAEPDFDLQFDPPWNALFDINLRNLVLEIDLKNKQIGFQYTGLNLDLSFISLSQIEVWYSLGAGVGVGKRVDLSLVGRLLGQDFKPSWDVLRQPPPATTGLGSQIFDLDYLGLGQHVTLRDSSKLTTLSSIIGALQAAHQPLDPAANPLKQLTALTFSRSSEWLIGAKFSVLKTVALSIIFNDPSMYGLRISLNGERAGSLSGLSFEVLYRKVTDSIGVYHIDLQLPDVLRQMEFGEASVTLPIITVDIYTNGNFLIDFGFPHNLDFSRSATIEVIILFVPVLGAGGFYFGVLDSHTSNQVSKITNGIFNPVIVAGFGLQIGLGKTIEKGIVRAGALVAIEGVLEGVLAFFQPSAPDAAKEIYFKVAGTIAIVGHIFGSIDFAIVKASLDIYVYASAQFVYETHEPALITLEAGVSIDLSVKIGWGFFSVTVHFSFQAHIHESFTIGSHSQAAWQLAPAGTLGTLAAAPAAIRSNAMFAAVAQAGLRWDQADAALLDDTTELDQIELIFVPHLTIGRVNDRPLAAGEADPGAANAVQVVGLLLIACATPGDASAGGSAPSAPARSNQLLLLGGAADTPATSLTAFEKLARATLRWVVNTFHTQLQAAGVQPNGMVAADDLRFIYQQISAAKSPLTLDVVANFLSSSFTQFVISVPPGSAPVGTYTVFPMLPFLTITPDGGTPIDFARDHASTEAYRQFITTYFEQLAAEAGASEIAQDPQFVTLGDQPLPPTMAAVVMADYIGLIARHVVQEALDLFQSYTYTANDGDTLASLTAIFGLTAADQIASIARANQSSQIFFKLGTPINIQGLIGQVGKDDTLSTFASRFGLTPLEVVPKIQDQPGALRPGAVIHVAGARYTTQPGDTLISIADHFFTSIVDILSANLGVDWTPTPGSGATLPVGLAINLPTIAYTVGAGDTLRGVYSVGSRDTLVSIATRFATTVDALLTANPSLDKGLATNADTAGLLPAVTQLYLPGIAGYFGVSATQLFDPSPATDPNSALAVAAAANLASKDLLTALLPVALPDLTYMVKVGDTPLSIAQQYGLTAEQLVSQNQGPHTSFGTIVLPNVGQLLLTTLVSKLAENQGFNRASGAVARFMLHGLRLPATVPDPATTVSTLGDGRIDLSGTPLFPLYQLVGQQWTPPAAPNANYGVTLALSDSSLGWIKLGTSTSSAPLKLPLHDAALIGPQNASLKTGAAPFNPGILALTEYPSYRVVPKRFAFGRPVLWQTPVAPVFGAGLALAAGMPQIYPFTSTLRRQLAATPVQAADLRITAGTRTAAGELPAATTAVTRFGWATRLDFVIRQAPDPDMPGQFIASVYEVYSTDQDGRQDLLSIVEYLRAADTPSDVQINLLYATDPVSGGQGLRSDVVNPDGVVLLKTNLSTLTNSPKMLELTLALVADPTPPPSFDATLNQPLQFLTLLWEGSVVNSGGYYLFYRNSDGEGLPAQLFNQTPTATLTVLVTIRPAQNSPTTIAVQPFHNCAICTENLDPANAVVFAEPPLYTVAAGDTLQTIAAHRDGVYQLGRANATIEHLLQPGRTIHLPSSKSYMVQVGDDLLALALALDVSLTDLIDAIATSPNLLVAGAQMYTDPAWVVRRASIPAGRAGFRMLRAQPSGNDSASQLAGLYHLLGFSMRGQGGFRASAEGLPVGPAEDRNETINQAPDGAPPWRYQRTLAIAHLAKPVAGQADWKLPSQNRYAGLGTSATINFQYHDIYGNRCLPDSAVPDLTISVRYRDPLLGLSQWPALVTSYDIGTGAASGLRVGLTFDPTLYLPIAGDTLDTTKQRAASDSGTVIPNIPRALSARAQYEQIYGQINQPDITFVLTTTLDQAQDHQLGQPTFRDFVVAAYNYLSVVGALRQVTAQIQATDTLGSIAKTYQIAAAALAVANQESPGLLAANADLILPVLYLVAPGDTLADIVQIAIQKTGQSAPSLTSQSIALANPNEELQSHTVLTIKGIAYTVAAGDTLASVAKAKQADNEQVEDLITQLAAANTNVADLFAPGTQLALGMVMGKTAAGDTLASIARARGLSVVALAGANQNQAGLMATGATIAIVGQLDCTDAYTVADGETLASIAARGRVTVAALQAANQGQSDPPKPGTTLRVPFAALHTVADSETLAGIATQNGLALAALASANQNLAGLLVAGGPSIALPGITLDQAITIETNDTLATLLARLQAHANTAVTLADLAAVLGPLAAGAKLMLPPPALDLTIDITPSFTELVVPLTVELAIRRPTDMVDPALRDEPCVGAVSTPVHPNLGTTAQPGSGAAVQELGLQKFAQRFETAFPTLKVATGAYSGGATAAANALVAVQFQNTTLHYAITPTPAFFAPRPISTSRWTGAQVPIDTYQRGIDPQLFPQTKRNFSDLDLDIWARDFLNAVDRFLSSEYAAAAYQIDAPAYRMVVQAKNTLAAAIRDMVEPILDPAEAGQSAGDLLAARELLYEHLLIRLATAYTIDTIVQFPASVTSPNLDAKMAPRLAGKLVGAPYRIPANATLQSLADAFGAPLDLLAAMIADHPHLLNIGFGVAYNSPSYAVTEVDTLASVAASLTPPATVVDLALALANTSGLLQQDAALNVIRRSYTQAAYHTLATVLARFQQLGAPALTLADLAAANKDRADLLRPGAVITTAAGGTYTVVRGDTLAGIASAHGVQLADLAAANQDSSALLLADPPATLYPPSQIGQSMSVTVRPPATLRTLVNYLTPRIASAQGLQDALANLAAMNPSMAASFTEAQLDVPDLIAPGTTVSFLSRIPGYSLSEAKLSLASGAPSPLTFFFQTSSDDQNSNIALRLAYQINELEYNIGSVNFADRYQSSDWLAFIQPAIDDSIGVVDIPIPLRIYPVPPSITGQTIVQPTLPAAPTLKDLRTYSYQFTYSYQPADQDRLIDGVRYNVADIGPIATDAASSDQLAYALAQYASSAGALNQDLATLASLRPAGNDPGTEQVARIAVQVFAKLVDRIATAWRNETAQPPAPADQDVYDARIVQTGDIQNPQTIAFANLDAIVQQNAWGSVRVTRNENLLLGQKTAGHFVYHTKDLRTSSKAAPLFTYRQPFDLASIPLRAGQSPTLAQRLLNLFAELLNIAPGSAPVVDCAVRVAASFGFLLSGAGATPTAGSQDSNITTLVPVLVSPHTIFTKADLQPGGLCDQLAIALNAWRDQNQVTRDRSMWVFDVSVYTTVGGDAAAAAPPLLELTNLRLALADAS